MRKDLGISGNLFGGNLVSWIDEAAASYACRICNTQRMTTLKINELIFKKPIKESDIIRIYGLVEKIGDTSITLELIVKKHNPTTSIEETTTSTQIVFVKIDENGCPTKINKK